MHPPIRPIRSILVAGTAALALLAAGCSAGGGVDTAAVADDPPETTTTAPEEPETTTTTTEAPETTETTEEFDRNSNPGYVGMTLSMEFYDNPDIWIDDIEDANCAAEYYMNTLGPEQVELDPFILDADSAELIAEAMDNCGWDIRAILIEAYQPEDVSDEIMSCLMDELGPAAHFRWFGIQMGGGDFQEMEDSITNAAAACA